MSLTRDLRPAIRQAVLDHAERAQVKLTAAQAALDEALGGGA